MRGMAWLAGLSCLWLGACANSPTTVGTVACGEGAKAGYAAELLFGRNIGERLGVSEEDWQGFLDAEISPRFPDGLTVLDAKGQWRDTATGRIVAEPSKLLVLVFFNEDDGRGKAGAIARAYKVRFDQQAVLTVIRPACVSF